MSSDRASPISSPPTEAVSKILSAGSSDGKEKLKNLIASANLESEISEEDKPKPVRNIEIYYPCTELVEDLKIDGDLRIVGSIDCGGDEPLSIKCSEDGNYILGCFSGNIRVYNYPNGHLEQTLEASPAEDEDGELECYPISRIRTKSNNGIDARPSGVVAATYFSGFLRLWDYTTGSLLGQVQDENKGAEYLCLSPNPFVDVTAVGLGNGSIKLYDETTLQVTSILKRSCYASAVDGHEDKVFCIVNHPLNPNEFVSAGWDQTLQFWDARTPKALRSIYGPFVCGEGLDINPNGKELLIANWRAEQSLQIIDYGTGKIMDEFEPERQPHYFYASKFVGKDNIVAVGSDQSIVKLFSRNKSESIASVLNLPNDLYDVCVHKKNSNKFMVANQNQVLVMDFGK